MSEWSLPINFQFGYDSSASNHVRLSKVKAWGDSLPESDDDPKHADIVILLTGWVTIINSFINGASSKDTE